MRTLSAALALFALLAPVVRAADGREVTVELPHPLRAGEAAVLEVQLGVIARGAEVQIATKSGRLLGGISPYGIRSGHAAGTYMVPLPADAIVDGRASLVVSVRQNNHPRAPTADELKSIQVKIIPAVP